jgi:hypothetical protein
MLLGSRHDQKKNSEMRQSKERAFIIKQKYTRGGSIGILRMGGILWRRVVCIVHVKGKAGKFQNGSFFFFFSRIEFTSLSFPYTGFLDVSCCLIHEGKHPIWKCHYNKPKSF